MIFLQKAFPFIDESLGQVDHSGPGLVDGRGDQIKLSNTKILNAPEWSTLYVPFTIRTVKAWVPNRAIWRKMSLSMQKKMLQTLQARQARSIFSIQKSDDRSRKAACFGVQTWCDSNSSFYGLTKYCVVRARCSLLSFPTTFHINPNLMCLIFKKNMLFAILTIQLHFHTFSNLTCFSPV